MVKCVTKEPSCFGVMQTARAFGADKGGVQETWMW